MDHFELLMEDAEHPFYGWHFGYIADRLVMAPSNWSFSTEIIPRLRKVNSMLDMGTGGGEYLSSLQPLPRNTHATEAYEPNIRLAKEKLEKIGVTVHGIVEYDPLPFQSNYFDLVMNRHEWYNEKDVYRILREEGEFVTQQVGPTNNHELNDFLGA